MAAIVWWCTLLSSSRWLTAGEDGGKFRLQKRANFLSFGAWGAACMQSSQRQDPKPLLTSNFSPASGKFTLQLLTLGHHSGPCDTHSYKQVLATPWDHTSDTQSQEWNQELTRYTQHSEQPLPCCLWILVAEHFTLGRLKVLSHLGQ